MNEKEFFKKYPSAKSLWKVGDKYFLHHAKDKAELCAAHSKQKMKEVKAPKQAKNNNTNGSE